MCGMAQPTKSDKQRQMDYQAEDDFRTLQRAEEVRGDTARHTRALGHGRKQISAISRVMGRAKTGRAAKRAPARPSR